MIRQAEKKAHMIDCRVIFNGGGDENMKTVYSFTLPTIDILACNMRVLCLILK